MEEYNTVYSKSQSEKIASEFSQIKDTYYLEHVGATLYSEIQISNVFEDLKNNLYGNPHAFNISSKFSEDVIDQMRYLVLNHFNTNPEEYSIIYTSGSTAALKMVAETFDYTNGHSETGMFMYLEDNHTSVLGMREYAKEYKILSRDEAFKIFNTSSINNGLQKGNSLFVYPAQCNFSGTKYPLSWIKKVQTGALNQFKSSKWFCMLDAASFVSSNKLDLNISKPDFVCLSFYKIFGYPTGLGALLVKNTSANILKKTYFGGGTVQLTLPSEHVLRTGIHERFEDGTLPFLSITSIRHGFDTLKRFQLDMDLISKHTFSLAKYLHHSLLLMHHCNGNPVSKLYHDTNFENQNSQGGIVNFNLLRANGQYIGYAEVLNMANLYRIHLRTGCFCNPGACQRHLKLSQTDVKQHFNAGHICGDQNDLIGGYPTGSIRVSFGYMSVKKDADKLIEMIVECFASKPLVNKVPNYWNDLKDDELYSESVNTNICNEPKNILVNNDIIEDFTQLSINNNGGVLKYIFLYPIKSCGAFSVENWQIETTGLSYDREWMIVTLAGVCLTQKQEPKMCLIVPKIKLNEELLEVTFQEMPPITIPLKVETNTENTEVSLCQSKVCGDRVKCFDCGDEIANWLCEALQRSDLRLVRQDSSHLRTNRKGQQSQLSLANQAQFLLLNIASVNYLAKSISNYDINNNSIYNLVMRFRPNLVINSSTPFFELTCKNVIIGNHTFKCTGPCTRCQMICIDQMTGEKTVEPLRTLSVLTESKIRFGVYLARIYTQHITITTSENVSYN